MARKLRVEYPGAVYHVMNRGDRREAIFQDNQDREVFLQLLGEACAKTGWRVYAWCLMPNHFHLVMTTPQPNLVAGMKWLLGTYTGRFNRRHRLFGRLFSGRYKAIVVDGSGTGYLKTVCDYVHLNPTRAKLVRPEQKLAGYPWSSLRYYLQPPGKRPGWLRVGPLLGEHHIPKDSPAGRREFGQRMQVRHREEDGTDNHQAIRRGWCLGGNAFRKELLAQMRERMGEHHYGYERAETNEARAETLVQEGLQRLGWKEADLAARLKGDRAKIKLAQRLRAETTMTLKWIAVRLQMGTWTHLNCLLYRQRRNK
jgi:REP element-mobilizing transposase RayT